MSDSLRKKPGDLFRADDFNALVDLARRYRLRPSLAPKPGEGEFIPPFWVTAQRWEDGIDSDQQWQVFIEPGWVNDIEATILYQRESDPRGWEIPEDHPAHDLKGTTVDRELLEADPPWLLLDSTKDFTATTVLPAYFRQEEYEGRKFKSAVVLILSSPTTAQPVDPRLPSARLTRQRIVSRATRPPVGFAAQAGGFVELATLWLMLGDEPAEDEIFVLQRQVWSLASAIIQPGRGLLEAIDAYGGDPLGLLGSAEENFVEAARVLFWTQ